MKSNRNLRFLINLALVALAVCFSAVGGNAQDIYKGKFTLPFQAHWGQAVLPAGDYTFTIPSLASPYVIHVRGEDKSAIVFAATADSRVVTSDHAQLNFANIGDEHFIRTFEVPQLGLVFVYEVPAAKEGINGTNSATLAPGATLASALTSGSVQSRLNNFLNLSSFIPGGNCVDIQNVVVPCTIGGNRNPAVQGRAIGNVGRNAFRGPFQQNWDMSITKNTKLSGLTSLDFRAEFFNIFNHPAFQGPQAGALLGNAVGNLGEVDAAGGTSAILATVNRPRIVQFSLKLNF